MNKFNIPIITLGSPYGVGYEIFFHTVKKNFFKNQMIVAAGSRSVVDFYLKFLKIKLNYFSIKMHELDKINKNRKNKFILIDIDENDLRIESLDFLKEKIDGQIALKSIEAAAELVKKEIFNSVVTLPVSKKNISLLNPSFTGHTEFFQKKWNEKSVFMCFLSWKLNVLLLTTHTAIVSVPKKIKPELIIKGILTAEILRKKLGLKNKLCFLGLNPHAGEEGILGTEEIQFKKIINILKEENKIDVDGPVPADTAFTKANLKKYSIFIACYHDQGLIPFKMLSFEDGVNLSFGMKHIRTSVDHGTAVDIIGKNKANNKSFINAYNIAKRLSVLK